MPKHDFELTVRPLIITIFVIDVDTKEFEISIGTPPASSLILKEAGIEKGSGNPKTDKVADVLIEQIIKIAKMKENNLLGNDLKAKVKEIILLYESISTPTLIIK